MKFSLSEEFYAFTHCFSSHLIVYFAGMGKTRRRNTIKSTYDNRGVHVPWSDLNHDVLTLVMMQLGVVEFLAFSGVCKSWRLLAFSNRDSFMVSKPPMSVYIYDDIDANNENECHLKDFEGRKCKTILPHSAGRMCIGVTCGYLILLGEKTNDIWLVNLITRHELHFPNVPVKVFHHPLNVRVILVVSTAISGWVLVVLTLCSNLIWFSIAGKPKWTKFPTPFHICDLHAFKGKIYTIHDGYPFNQEIRLCEMILYPKPKLVLLETQRFPDPYIKIPWFVSSGENLYVIDRISEHPHKNIHEIDFGVMKLVSGEKTGEKYVFFRNQFKDGTTIIARDSWVDLRSQYGNCVLTDNNGMGGLFSASMWYFFHDCLNVNLLDK